MSNIVRRRRSAIFLLVSFVAVAMASRSFAHEQKVALTDILFNKRTGNLEIAHRISLHDAEHTLHKISESSVDLTKSTKAQKAFGKYVAQRFGLFLEDKTKLKLTLVGQEIERGYLWVYQETKIPKPAAASFIITNTILQDVIKGQVNTVNIRDGSRVATLSFKANSGQRRYAGSPSPDKKKEEAEEQ
jgi:hypothetical protein